MSSMVRTMQKRILKRMGYARQTHKVVVLGGVPNLVRLGKGKGDILNPQNEPIGRHWPRPASAGVAA